MSVILSLCLMWPGVCDSAEFDHYLETVVIDESAGPVERWRPLVAFRFPADEVDRALCIISRESGGDPGADNPRSSARGLFQILGSLWAPYYGVSRADLYDPNINVLLAHDIWERYGWWAWSPYKRGSCR